MANVINATSAGNGGLVSTGDDSGILNIQTNEVTAVTIDTSQNVGIGTSSPSFVVGSTGLQISGSSAPTVRLNSPTSSLEVISATSASYVWVTSNTPLVFGTNATERMRIDSSGNLLVGTTSTSSPTSSTADIFCGGLQINPSRRTTALGASAYWATDGFLYRSTSSLRYKTNIADYQKGLSEVLQLRPVSFNSISLVDGSASFAGFIAEEVDALGLKEFVQYDGNGRPDALSYAQITALLTKAIQEQQALITSLTARIAALEGAQQ